MHGPLAVSFVTQRHFSQTFRDRAAAERLALRLKFPFLATSFPTPARVRMVFAGAVSATGSEAGKVSSRASSSISSSVGGRFGTGLSIASSLHFGTGFMSFSKATLASGSYQSNALPAGHVALIVRLASCVASLRNVRHR